MLHICSENCATGSTYDILAFTLGKDEYGMALEKVHEIRSYQTVSLNTNTTEYAHGYSTLRDSTVPVMDIRMSCNSSLSEGSAWPVVLIVNLARRKVGMVVDGISDVISLSAAQIRPAHEYAGASNTSQYVTAIGAVESRLLNLLDIESLASSRNFQAHAAAQEKIATY